MRLVDLIELERSLQTLENREAVKGQPKAERGHEPASPTATLEGHGTEASTALIITSGSDPVRPLAASPNTKDSVSSDEAESVTSE